MQIVLKFGEVLRGDLSVLDSFLKRDRWEPGLLVAAAYPIDMKAREKDNGNRPHRRARKVRP